MQAEEPQAEQLLLVDEVPQVRAREARAGGARAVVAERAGVARATVNRIEQGTVTGVEFTTLERLADALGVNAAILVAHERAPEPRNGARSR